MVLLDPALGNPSLTVKVAGQLSAPCRRVKLKLSIQVTALYFVGLWQQRRDGVQGAGRRMEMAEIRDVAHPARCENQFSSRDQHLAEIRDPAYRCRLTQVRKHRKGVTAIGACLLQWERRKDLVLMHGKRRVEAARALHGNGQAVKEDELLRRVFAKEKS